MARAETPDLNGPLDALNFFLADVRDGLGPYLAIYLLTEQKWDEASTGAVMSVSALAGIVAQTPAGALIDRSTGKRALMVGAAVLVTLACLTLPLIHRFELVAATQAVAAAAGAIFAPAVAAVTLGIVGPKAFARRTGRNEAFNHAGNAVAAAIAGISAYSFGPIVVFWLLAAMAVASIFATLSIPSGAIDDHGARGLDGLTARDVDDPDKPSGLQVLLTCKPLLVFAVATVAFHFSNAAMLPLVGQKLALVHRRRNLRRAVSACRRRPDARHGPFQYQPGRDCDRRRIRRRAEHGRGRPHHRQERIQRGLPVSGRDRGHRPDRILRHDAGDAEA